MNKVILCPKTSPVHRESVHNLHDRPLEDDTVFAASALVVVKRMASIRANAVFDAKMGHDVPLVSFSVVCTFSLQFSMGLLLLRNYVLL